MFLYTASRFIFYFLYFFFMAFFHHQNIFALFSVKMYGVAKSCRLRTPSLEIHHCSVPWNRIILYSGPKSRPYITRNQRTITRKTRPIGPRRRRKTRCRPSDGKHASRVVGRTNLGFRDKKRRKNP